MFKCYCTERYFFTWFYPPRNSAAHDAGITCLIVAKDADSSTWYVYNLYGPISEQHSLIVLHHMLHHLLRSNTEVYYRPGLVSVIGSFRTARLSGQATCTAEPLRVSVSNNPTIDQNIIPGLPGSGTTGGNCVVWLVFGREAVTKGEHCAQLVSCPARACLPARNNLVNKVEFITQKW